MRRHVFALLMVVNLALAGLLAWLWFTPDGRVRGVSWQPVPAIAPALPEVKPLPRVDVDVIRYVATLERPLFVAGRRPPLKAESGPPPPPPDPMPDIQLLGIYGNPSGGGMVASVNGEIRRVRVGEPISGRWTLKALQGGGVVVARGGQERKVELVRDSEAMPFRDGVVDGQSTTRTPTARVTISRPTATAQQLERLRALRQRRNAPQ